MNSSAHTHTHTNTTTTCQQHAIVYIPFEDILRTFRAFFFEGKTFSFRCTVHGPDMILGLLTYKLRAIFKEHHLYVCREMNDIGCSPLATTLDMKSSRCPQLNSTQLDGNHPLFKDSSIVWFFETSKTCLLFSLSFEIWSLL